jgi:hypothetical protein
MRVISRRAASQDKWFAVGLLSAGLAVDYPARIGICSLRDHQYMRDTCPLNGGRGVVPTAGRGGEGKLTPAFQAIH